MHSPWRGRTRTPAGIPSSLVLDVAGSLSTSLPLGLNDTFSFAGVPPGTYTFTLRALNASGSSQPSSPVTLTFPGPCSGPPLAPSGFIAYKVGSTIHRALGSSGRRAGAHCLRPERQRIVRWRFPDAGAADVGDRGSRVVHVQRRREQRLRRERGDNGSDGDDPLSQTRFASEWIFAARVGDDSLDDLVEGDGRLVADE